MIFDRTHSFEKAFRQLPADVKKIFFEKTALMELHFDHPSLRVKKIIDSDDIYEGSVNMHYRFTFQLIPGGILLRNIGKHDSVFSGK
jgi:hypothetical protein